jgi:HK97 family phage portal protein
LPRKRRNRVSSIENRSLENPANQITGESFREVDLASPAGEPKVVPSSIIGYAPFFQAVSMISGDVAKLPLSIIKKENKKRTVLDSHPVQQLLNRHGMANIEVSSYKFLRRFVACGLLWGNSYAYIDRSNDGRVLGFYQLLPDRTYMARHKGKLVCITEVSTASGGATLESIDAADVLHIEGLSINGIEGVNIGKAFREDFLIALSSKRFTSKFFANNMNSSGILQAPPGASADAIKKVSKKLEDKSGSDSAFKTIVLRDGFKWFSTQIDPQKSQLTETNEEGARNVARMFNISPSKLGLKDSTSYNSEEAATSDYFDGALSHWLLSVSTEITTKCLTVQERAQGIYAEHNINALLWADASTRSQIGITGITNGVYSPNEVRSWNNDDGYEGGDQYYMPLNIAPVGSRPVSDTTEPARSILKETFARAINRICIKAERKKSNPVAEDLEGIRTIVSTASDGFGKCFGVDGSKAANDWIESIALADHESLRSVAEQEAEKTIERILGQS